MSLAWVVLSAPASRMINSGLLLLEIRPVTGTVVDPLLCDTFTNRLDISGISSNETFNPCLDARSRPEVPQVVEPLNEEVSLAQFDHGLTVAGWLHIAYAMHALWRRPTWRCAARAARRNERRVGRCNEHYFYLRCRFSAAIRF